MEAVTGMVAATGITALGGTATGGMAAGGITATAGMAGDVAGMAGDLAGTLGRGGAPLGGRTSTGALGATRTGGTTLMEDMEDILTRRIIMAILVPMIID